MAPEAEGPIGFVAQQKQQAKIAVGSAYAVDVYVDSVLGSDANPGTQAAPLLTIGAVYQKFPMFMIDDAAIVVHLVGDATGVRAYPCSTLWLGGLLPYKAAYQFKGPAKNRVTPTTGPATAALDVVPATETGFKCAFSFATAAPGWTAHDFQGAAWIRVKRGVTLVGDWPIADNGASTIVVDAIGIAAGILATDTVEIVRPAVRVLGTVAAYPGSLTIAGYGGQPPFDSSGACFENVEFGLLADDGVLLSMGVEGLTFDGCLFSCYAEFRGGTTGVVNCKATGVGSGGGITQVIWACGSEQIANPGNAQLVTVYVGIMLMAVHLIVGGNEPVNNAGRFYTWLNVSVYNAPSAGLGAIDVKGPGSSFYADSGQSNAGGGVALQGSGSAGPAIRCALGALARVNGGTRLTIAGTGNPLAVGTRAAVAYGTGAGQFEEVAGLNGNLLEDNTPGNVIPGASRITTKVA